MGAIRRPQGPSVTQMRSRMGPSVVIRAKGGGDDGGNELLDFLQAKRKLRRWYGEGEREAAQAEMRELAEQDDEGEAQEDDVGGGDAVLVLGCDSALGEQVTLQLILERADVKLVVADVAAAKTSYGDYVRAVSCDLGSPGEIKRALQGCGSVIVAGKVGALTKVLKGSGVAHVLLLSTAGTSSGGGGFLGGLLGGGSDETLADVRREGAVMGCGVSYTILRSPEPKFIPGGKSTLELTQGPPVPRGGPISGEDLAKVAVEALKRPPARGACRELQVSILGPGAPPEDASGWLALFAGLQEGAMA
ncbi:hypothetical protein FOA52_000767 [Chlamydomonas sp. UWO 241]|nr:hypothetical protein FOA52_000767 [Chlamydomonas sp. UWO 241]